MRRVVLIAACLGLAACASAPVQPLCWVTVAQSTRWNPDECRGVMFTCREGVGCDSDPFTVAVGYRIKRTYRFGDIACRKAWANCYRDGMTWGTSVCYDDPTTDPLVGRDQGPPRLEVRHPRVLLAGTAGPYGAMVTFYAEVLGEIDEKWYCPEIRVIWPDTTESRRESDCPPWEERVDEQRFRWTFTRALASGTHYIEFQLLKAGELLATETVEVTVTGGGDPYEGR